MEPSGWPPWKTRLIRWESVWITPNACKCSQCVALFGKDGQQPKEVTCAELGSYSLVDLRSNPFFFFGSLFLGREQNSCISIIKSQNTMKKSLLSKDFQGIQMGPKARCFWVNNDSIAIVWFMVSFSLLPLYPFSKKKKKLVEFADMKSSTLETPVQLQIRTNTTAAFCTTQSSPSPTPFHVSVPKIFAVYI